MKRFLKGALAAVLLLVAVAAGGVYWLVSGDGIRLALEQQASGWLGQPVRIGAARGQLFPRVGIKLGDVRIGEPARVTLADVDVSTGLRALLQRRIADADVRVRNSRINLPLPFALPSGGGSTGAKGATVSGLMRIESIRSIALQNVTVASRGREIRVSASSSLVGARLELQEFSAESGHTSVRAEGLIELEPRVDAKLRVRAARLDLDELLILANAFAGRGAGDGVGSRYEVRKDSRPHYRFAIADRGAGERGGGNNRRRQRVAARDRLPDRRRPCDAVAIHVPVLWRQIPRLAQRHHRQHALGDAPVSDHRSRHGSTGGVRQRPGHNHRTAVWRRHVQRIGARLRRCPQHGPRDRNGRDRQRHAATAEPRPNGRAVLRTPGCGRNRPRATGSIEWT